MTRSDLPAGTVTFLFTDVEGSTKLLHALGAEGYAEALAEHRRVLREAFARHGGVEVDTQGDAFFVAFPTAPGALGAASEATEALTDGPIKVRIGLHTGSPLLGEEGYIGPDVHRAARIAAAGHGGQVLVSAATAQLVDGTDLRDLGEHRLKDLSAPERIYQLGDAEFPPLKTLHQTNLPIPATPFLGRDAEVADVSALLARDGVRLVTLTGPGGTGKTRLALAVAGGLAERYPDGVWWVPLAPLRDPALVLESAAAALGASGDLAEHIADKRLLLLLDNFEHLMEAADGLAPLLGACPNLSLLVTSREPLHLAGEHEYAVDPLRRDEAVELFRSRALAARRDVTANGEIAQICERLDHLPLAIELAAARVKVLSPKALLERLEQRLPLLAGGARDLPERQRTLRATIEWSHELLTPDEQRLFARLSVFRGGCTLEAAEAVADASLDTLQSLVDKSLVRVRDDRFWMLETIREFAVQQLDASGEADDLRRRHAEFFLALAEAAEPHLRGDPKEWLDRLEHEHDNLRAALDRFEAAGEGEAMQRLAGALWRFFSIRGYMTEGRRRLEAALRMDERATLGRIRSLNGATAAALDAGDTATARARAEEAVALSQRVADPWTSAVSVQLLGNVCAEGRQWERALHHFETALEQAREMGDEHLILLQIRLVAWMHYEQGDVAKATALHEEVVRRARASGNPRMLATSLGALGEYALEDGRFKDALPLLAECASLARDVGERPEVLVSLWRLSRVLAKAGRHSDAARIFAAAESLRDEMGLVTYTWIERLNAETLATLHAVLADHAFADAWEAGRSLSVEQAVALALAAASGD